MPNTGPDRPISDLLQTEDYSKAVDLRGEPTHICICGSYLWRVIAAFEDYEMVYHYLDMECVNCGSLATAPTPDDMPEGYVPTGRCCPDEDGDD